ncbi:MAG: osmoprotectant transport system substrate-binding protein opuBD [Solirubrobacteraceae bacterium]|jgi:glycine betaine/choline ABC-type transport system substrate-binding protein|nr:osmoprotectant transport system substrate-binding protein opuBD [Solirubrobacteraceae bacterium]
MTPTHRRTLAALAAICLTLGVAACGSSDNADTKSPATGGKAIARDPANASKPAITVASKNFTEQYILGEIYAQTLEAQGFKVKRRLNLGSEQVAYKALRGGSIDMYPEYTGTALTSFFKVKTADVPKDADAAYALAKKDYAQNAITALPRTPFQNTFVIASTKATAGKAGNPKTVSELFAKNPKLSISGFPECRQREDCLLGLRSVYGFKGKFVSSNGKFNDLDGGQSDLTLAFGTDPQLALTDKYVAYEDDKHFFPPYHITLGVRDATVKTIGPKAIKTLESVQEGMTEEAMRELNRRVELDKQTAKDVGAAYLREEKLVP